MDTKKMQNTLPELKILVDEPLANYTYTKTGGPADALVFPKNRQELKEVVHYANMEGISWQVLGNASNLIVRDSGIRGIVILLSEMAEVVVENQRIVAESGAKLIDVTKKALDASLSGLEFACGIPGSIGGAVYMNAGAYGGEIKDVLSAIDVMLEDGTITTWTKEDLSFSYRHSALQQQKAIVLSASFDLEAGSYPVIAEKMAELTDLRESKQPLEYPSCGSVFKRPKGHYTGPLIIEAGLQGYQIGGAQVSTKHAGFIVNIDHATATDYIQLIHHIQEVVKEKFDVELETEVRIIGEE
ncbi:UDP-N-acetylmuramate dehydrogenase [Catellicoccus marimammalium]|uniref:UDP-N-acetylenolpyruvoylglucosamine reductase n=1 Tax=Catellicoccus marimammalium M35/04/3 TaxID=1234409 RepID=K8ZA14_9ENTE|nr:UDP-N-acetylmuramate dehydrogenase [Catellicoccus marimammalium]EKU27894.1 UDP-N-acetylenolpyruvoylglucosamine reductase [Catellicoccus marimammalium M35/04/3]